MGHTDEMNDALAEEIERSRFTPVRLREGYDMNEVDTFLDRLCAMLRAGEPVAATIAAARFTPVRMREGYDMDEVDRLLARASASDAEDSTVVDAAPSAGEAAYANPIEETVSPLARLFGRRGRNHPR